MDEWMSLSLAWLSDGCLATSAKPVFNLHEWWEKKKKKEKRCMQWIKVVTLSNVKRMINDRVGLQAHDLQQSQERLRNIMSGLILAITNSLMPRQRHSKGFC